MDTIGLKKCEDELVKRKHQILPTLKHLHERSAVVTGEAEVIDRLTECYRRELASIERALSRMPSGTYGHCLACHKPIEKWRLESSPNAEFCLGCQSFREELESA